MQKKTCYKYLETPVLQVTLIKELRLRVLLACNLHTRMYIKSRSYLIGRGCISCRCPGCNKIREENSKLDYTETCLNCECNLCKLVTSLQAFQIKSKQLLWETS